MKHVVLYSTLGCHLCEKAKAVLWPILSHYSYRLVEVDIAQSDSLIDRYGIHIPVLADEQGLCELYWPFDAANVVDFLDSLTL